MTIHLNRLAAFSAAAATSVLLLTGCGTSTPTASNSAANPITGTGTSVPPTVVSPSMVAGGAISSAGGTSTSGMPMPAQPAGPHNQPDVTFAQQMSVHHQGAITMADLAATRAFSPKVKTLAVQIKAAQAPELKQMAGWLAAWAPSTDMNGMPSKTAASMSAMGSGTSSAPSAMPGMMSDAQMAQLTTATGPAFDKLFLQLMIVHHQGALTMADTETAQGQNPAALTLAKSITTSQTAQITQMQNILKTL